MSTPTNRSFNGSSLIFTPDGGSAVNILATQILSISPSSVVKEVDVSAAGEDEIIEPGQQKDTLTVDVIGATPTGLTLKAVGTLAISRADTTTRNMTEMCLVSAEEKGSKNNPWSTTLKFAKSRALSA